MYYYYYNYYYYNKGGVPLVVFTPVAAVTTVTLGTIHLLPVRRQYIIWRRHNINIYRPFGYPAIMRF